MSRRYAVVDVFTATPMMGNPLAVVVDGEGLDEAAMQRLARWTNVSETSFLLPPTPEGRAAGADYRVRIFSPGRELPFAGHPTLGSCFAWLQHGGQPRVPGTVVQECGIGLVTVRQGERLAFNAPPLRRTCPVEGEERQQAIDSLGLRDDELLDLQWIDNGPGWMGARLASAERVLSLRPDFARMRGLKLGVVGPQPVGSDCAFEVRAFVPTLGVPEDPVTGSLQAGLARWLIGAGLAPERYVAAQGQALGRAGRVHVEREGDAVWIGGDVLALVRGEIAL
jgi:PhzF family phenazine biosynthesis protein